MAGSLEVHAWVGENEVTASARVDELGIFGESYSHDTPYTFPLSNGDWLLGVKFQDQPKYEEVITISDNNVRRDVYFAASTKGTLTVYGRWDGQDIPVSFTIDEVSGGPWTTAQEFLLESGEYTVRAHWKQQDKIFYATVYAEANTDVILQFDWADYAFMTVLARIEGVAVVARVRIVDENNNTLYDMHTDFTVSLLPGAYTLFAEYQGLTDTKDVTIASPSDDKLVTFTFVEDGNGDSNGDGFNWGWVLIGIGVVMLGLAVYWWQRE